MNQANQSASFGTLFSALAALTAPGQGFLTSKPPYQTVAGLQVRDRLGRRLGAALRAARGRREQARAGRALRRLDDRLLRDMGLSRADVGVEPEPPFVGLGDPLVSTGGAARGPTLGEAKHGLWQI